ncbi:MmgE/PrpD family protein [Roseomonas terrae]|jgi:2-methylcitrate dehydratase PrpD|uniref:MmgE/PrpD family protein n=1 Tax=Neoroseomonas terrae TaxID=424799 RepID=A0ABS5EGK2_9PROT|nr:MmgE/PrpD family protein [Neoroseomonas terrae]MBR0650145.1 MmgE/PrpD family protein [Neoroseomonas terrae]
MSPTLTAPVLRDAVAAPTEARHLARFALALSLDDVPPALIRLAKEHLLDVIGIALASSRFDFGAAILKGASELGTGGQASAIGSGAALPPASAALVNGVLAHGLDFDDTHVGAIYHASAPAMAAVLASGQASRASGEEVLTAFIAALEIGCRLATVGAGKLHDRSFHPTSLFGTFAAAAAAGRLTRTAEEQLVWALGICGSQAAGILERGNSWLKRLHPGWAAHAGLSAVSLARGGFIGPDTVFEGRRGFYFAHTGEIPHGEALPSHRLGREWQAMGIALKPYPCCHFIHAFVDAALELRGKFALPDIAAIECPLTPSLHKMVAEPRERVIRPETIYSAQFSVPYVVALALVTGRVDLASFHDDPLDDPAVLRIAALAECTPDPLSDYPKHFPGEVIVTLKDGRVLRSRKPASLGTPDVPLTAAAVEAKFRANATRAVSAETATAIIEAVNGLEREASLDRLMQLCTA